MINEEDVYRGHVVMETGQIMEILRLVLTVKAVHEE